MKTSALAVACASASAQGGFEGLGLCWVDRDKCNECLVCLDYCPVDALAIQEEARK